MTETDEVSQLASVSPPEVVKDSSLIAAFPIVDLLMAKKKPRPAGEPTGQRPSVVVAVLAKPIIVPPPEIRTDS